MRAREHHNPNDRERDEAELKAALYAFASRGVVGLLTWVFRRPINEALARRLTVGAAIATWIAALGVLAIANRNAIDWLTEIAIYAVLGIPLLAVFAWVMREQRGVLAAEHGRDSEAYRDQIEAWGGDDAQTAMQDDWVLDPPWRRPDADGRPRFGATSEPP